MKKIIILMSALLVSTVGALSAAERLTDAHISGQPQKVVEMLKNYPNEKLF